MSMQIVSASKVTDDVIRFHQDIDELCVARLHNALGISSSLFDRQLRHKRWEATCGTEEVTSTAICLIGLHRAGIDPTTIGLDINTCLTALVNSTRRHRYPGALGLVIWANAVWDGMTLDELLQRIGFLLDEPKTFVASITTMETAWLVSGLIHECHRSPGGAATAALTASMNELIDRHETATGLFRHASDEAPMVHRLRKWVANFADQIYSIQALSLVSLLWDNQFALEVADQCAAALVRLQGDLGQWWWHYDPRHGKVAQAYPVYSVHQHAMAPMALMTLAAAGGAEHQDAIERSHRWIHHNESGIDLLDLEQGTIWRDVNLNEGPTGRLMRKARSVVGMNGVNGVEDAGHLIVNYETRPYEWAWCLYAGAMAAGTAVTGHLV